MKTYPNFYESIAEAHIRLLNTVVMYDGKPYAVHWISEHFPDDIFRIYIYPIGDDAPACDDSMPEVRKLAQLFGTAEVGQKLDEWIAENPDTFLLRKQMDSPLFNRFRPFPLGMVNHRAKCWYVERQPIRHTEQGLTECALDTTLLSLSGKAEFPMRKGPPFEMYSQGFADCILGNYPTAQECLENLLDSQIVNNAAAFHRRFAFVRGPIGTVFLAHKTDIVAAVPYNNFNILRLSRDFSYLRETIEELNLFHDVLYR